MSNPTEWDRFEVRTISPATWLKRNLIHLALLRAVVQRARSGVLEVGVGSGAQSALLSRIVGPVTTVDNDHRIMGVARSNLARFGRGVRPVSADAFRLPFPDRAFGVAVSQGLMEHFADGQIIDLVQEQLRVARSVVFSVPSDRYPRQDVGNERLMPPEAWAALLGRRISPEEFRIRASYYRVDPEALKYSVLARRWLGSFSVLVTIDRSAVPVR